MHLFLQLPFCCALLYFRSRRHLSQVQLRPDIIHVLVSFLHRRTNTHKGSRSGSLPTIRTQHNNDTEC
jgi:hypothetical protein